MFFHVPFLYSISLYFCFLLVILIHPPLQPFSTYSSLYLSFHSFSLFFYLSSIASHRAHEKPGQAPSFFPFLQTEHGRKMLEEFYFPFKRDPSSSPPPQIRYHNHSIFPSRHNSPPLTRFNNKSTIYPHFSSYYLFFRSSTTIISPEFVIGKRTTGTTGRKREKRERERQRDEGTNIICPGSFVGFVAGTAANKKRILFVLAASLHKVSPSLVHRNKL